MLREPAHYLLSVFLCARSTPHKRNVLISAFIPWIEPTPAAQTKVFNKTNVLPDKAINSLIVVFNVKVEPDSKAIFSELSDVFLLSQTLFHRSLMWKSIVVPASTLLPSTVSTTKLRVDFCASGTARVGAAPPTTVL
jgi:hypothetical protein